MVKDAAPLRSVFVCTIRIAVMLKWFVHNNVLERAEDSSLYVTSSIARAEANETQHHQLMMGQNT